MRNWMAVVMVFYTLSEQAMSYSWEEYKGQRKYNHFGRKDPYQAKTDIPCKCLPLFIAEICKGSHIKYAEKNFTDSDMCCLNCSDQSMFKQFCDRGTLDDNGPSSTAVHAEIYIGGRYCKYLSPRQMIIRIMKNKGFGTCLDVLNKLCPERMRPKKLGLQYIYLRQKKRLRREHGAKFPKSTMPEISTLSPRKIQYSYQ